jgi:acetyl-CoA C-acetyltransferase
MKRTSIDPARVADVIFSQGYGNAEAPAIGHWSWLAAGHPLEVPGYQLDRRCGSGLQAVVNAAMMVQTGMSDVVVAGGVESMSNVEYYTIEGRRGTPAGGMMLHDRLTRGRIMSQPIERFGVISGMIETAENLAKDYKIGREACDAYAVRSHQRAAAAWKNGLFDDELVPVPIPQRKGDPMMFAHDEGYRADASMETLGALKPIEAKTIPGAVVTAGNASQQNDAAAACLVVAEDKLEELGLTPIAWFHGWAAAGCDPSRMGIGPVPAVQRLFARTGLSWKDIDLVELNEAFAPQVLACLKGWGWSDNDSRNDILNVNGSIGATGGRILANLTRELVRRKGRYGLETMCIGGGQGIAAIFERAA